MPLHPESATAASLNGILLNAGHGQFKYLIEYRASEPNTVRANQT